MNDVSRVRWASSKALAERLDCGGCAMVYYPQQVKIGSAFCTEPRVAIECKSCHQSISPANFKPSEGYAVCPQCFKTWPLQELIDDPDGIGLFERPKASKLRYLETATRLEFGGGTRARWMQILAVTLGCFMTSLLVAWAWFFLREALARESSLFAGASFGFSMVLGGVALLIGFAAGLYSSIRTELVITRTQVIRIRRLLWNCWPTVENVAELVEVQPVITFNREFPESPHVRYALDLIFRNGKTLRFGDGLTREEIVWVRSTLEYFIYRVTQTSRS